MKRYFYNFHEIPMTGLTFRETAVTIAVMACAWFLILLAAFYS